MHQLCVKFNSVDTMTEIIACDVLIKQNKNEKEKKTTNHGYSYEREDWH